VISSNGPSMRWSWADVHGDTERCNIPVPSGACSTPAVCKPSTPLVGRIRVPGLQAAANDIADDDQFRDRPQRHRHLRRQNSEPTLPVRHVGPLCRDAEVLVEPECRDRVSPHELVGLLGIKTAAEQIFSAVARECG
jgi:hypothetical protein